MIKPDKDIGKIINKALKGASNTIQDIIKFYSRDNMLSKYLFKDIFKNTWIVVSIEKDHLILSSNKGKNASIPGWKFYNDYNMENVNKVKKMSNEGKNTIIYTGEIVLTGDYKIDENE